MPRKKYLEREVVAFAPEELNSSKGSTDASGLALGAYSDQSNSAKPPHWLRQLD